MPTLNLVRALVTHVDYSVKQRVLHNQTTSTYYRCHSVNKASKQVFSSSDVIGIYYKVM